MERDAVRHAVRRARTARMKQRVRFYYRRDLAENPRHWGLALHTRALCSGWCRGNPRRHSGRVTRQEHKADIALAEELGRSPRSARPFEHYYR